MVDLSKTRRKIEDIPSDNGKVVDTIAGALLRTFVRLNELDQANARLGLRVAVLEGQRQTRPGSCGEATGSARRRQRRHRHRRVWCAGISAEAATPAWPAGRCQG
jgi:hypothetical protein